MLLVRLLACAASIDGNDDAVGAVDTTADTAGDTAGDTSQTVDTSGEPDTGESNDSGNPDTGGGDPDTAQDSADTTDTGGTDTAGTDTAGTDTGDTASGTWRSALYAADWTPDWTNADGLFLHDFSYAGYHAGEAPLPSPPGASFDVTTYGADPTGGTDATSAIQAAIDAASAAAPAVVDLPAGTYRVDGTLAVSTSGVVLRGAGPTLTYVYFTQTAGMDYAAHLTFAGRLVEGEDHALTTDTPARTTVLPLADTSGIAVGDTIHVGWTITDAFVADHGMTDVWVSFNDQWKAFFRRTVTAVDATSVTVDVPIRYPALTRDGASVRVATGYLTECGLQDLALSNANDWDTTWTTTQVHAALFSGVQDCWVDHVSSWASPLGGGYHLMSSGIEVLDSRQVTIADTTLGYAEHRGDGGNGYLYEISRSNEILTRDSVGDAGRHNFIQNWDFGTSGCVWLRDTSENGRSLLGSWDPVGYPSYSEYHHSLAMANLVDSCVATDGWQGVNRQDESSGAGQTVTESAWWNTSGGGYLRSLQYGNGFVIGTDGMNLHTDPAELDWNNAGEGTDPADWTEGVDAGPTLDPQSLYEDQLVRRIASH